jgi:transposase
MWGGAGPGGFVPIIWHKKRKIDSEEWVKLVKNGDLTKALRSVNPGKRNGPWGIICDNETFLRAKISRAAHTRANITLMKIPPKSPDFNPIEKFWAWVRRRLLLLDLRDLAKKRLAASRTLYKARLIRIMKSKKAQEVAGNCVRGLRKVALEVKKKKGAASRG